MLYTASEHEAVYSVERYQYLTQRMFRAMMLSRICWGTDCKSKMFFDFEGRVSDKT